MLTVDDILRGVMARNHSSGGIGDLAGGVNGAYQASKQQAPKKPQPQAAQKATADQFWREHGSTMHDMPASTYDMRAGGFAPTNKYQLTMPQYMTADQASDYMKVNKEADQTRIGGQFTQEGANAADAAADADAQDRMKAKQFMGLGGTMAMAPGMGPGEF